MRVKRFVVDSMPDALQQIRAELGKDAVILNTKEIRSGGFLGLFSKKKIEVIAATDTASASANAGHSRQPAAAARLSQTQPDASYSSAGVAVLEQKKPPIEAPPSLASAESRASFAEKLIAARQSEQITGSSPTVPLQQGAALYSASAAGSAPKPAESSSSDTKPAVSAASRNAAVSVEAGPSAAEDAVLAELRAMKQMMLKMSAGGGTLDEPNPVLEDLRNRLLEQELSQELVHNLMEALEAAAGESGEEITPESAKLFMKDKLRIILGVGSNRSLEPDTKIAHFVGPTGVGKTTTIAKLAAEQVLKYRRKVGFITSDTYRIAAVDQLKTYATILGVPLEVVFSPLDLKKAFDALQDRDIIFMDTAGRNFRNEMYVSELNALLHTGGKSETYLVLSLTTKYKDMRAIAENFSRFKLDKVLLTKRDETDTFGPVVNLLHEFPLQLSYITTGQNVPDDFAVANENEIIDLILEEQSDE